MFPDFWLAGVGVCRPLLCFSARLALACAYTLYVRIRHDTSAHASIRQDSSGCARMRQHTSAYVSIRSPWPCLRAQWQLRKLRRFHATLPALKTLEACQAPRPFLRTRQHTSEYVSIRQHTPAFEACRAPRPFLRAGVRLKASYVAAQKLQASYVAVQKCLLTDI